MCSSDLEITGGDGGVYAAGGGAEATGFGARIFISGENLFTLTDYRGGDPETVDPYTGVDNYNAYPLSRRFTIGLTLNF